MGFIDFGLAPFLLFVAAVPGAAVVAQIGTVSARADRRQATCLLLKKSMIESYYWCGLKWVQLKINLIVFVQP
jgi:hypothetical protein